MLLQVSCKNCFFFVNIHQIIQNTKKYLWHPNLVKMQNVSHTENEKMYFPWWQQYKAVVINLKQCLIFRLQLALEKNAYAWSMSEAYNFHRKLFFMNTSLCVGNGTCNTWFLYVCIFYISGPFSKCSEQYFTCIPTEMEDHPYHTAVAMQRHRREQDF